jgi:hypothetical protein
VSTPSIALKFTANTAAQVPIRSQQTPLIMKPHYLGGTVEQKIAAIRHTAFKQPVFDFENLA